MEKSFKSKAMCKEKTFLLNAIRAVIAEREGVSSQDVNVAFVEASLKEDRIKREAAYKTFKGHKISSDRVREAPKSLERRLHVAG